MGPRTKSLIKGAIFLAFLGICMGAVLTQAAQQHSSDQQLSAGQTLTSNQQSSSGQQPDTDQQPSPGQQSSPDQQPVQQSNTDQQPGSGQPSSIGQSVAGFGNVDLGIGGTNATDPSSGMKITFVARSCTSFTNIMSNRVRDNSQEALSTLGNDSNYSSDTPVNPANETAPSSGQSGCQPYVGASFAIGTGSSTSANASTGKISQITSSTQTATTTSQVPELNQFGAPTGDSIAGAVTIDLSATAKKAVLNKTLRAMGGTTKQPVPNGYSFGTLRCALDNKSNVNVQSLDFTGATHVFCYAYYRTGAVSAGTITIKQTVDSSVAAFNFDGNGSFDSNPFALSNGQSITFYRAVDTQWNFNQMSNSGSTLSLTCPKAANVQTAIAGSNARILLSKAGATASCTFTNTLIKQVCPTVNPDPSTGPQAAPVNQALVPGLNWIRTSELGTGAAGAAFGAKVTYHQNGQAVAVWADKKTTLKSATLDLRSNTWTPGPDIVTNTTNPSQNDLGAHYIGITTMPDDSILVAFASVKVNTPASSAICATRWRPGQTTWDQIRQVSSVSNPPYSGGNVTAVALPSGDAFVTWKDSKQALGGAKYSALNDSWSNPAMPDSVGTLAYRAVTPNVTYDKSTQRLILNWVVSNGTLFSSIQPLNSSTWSRPEDIAVTNGCCGAAVSADDAGRVVAVWRAPDLSIGTAALEPGTSTWKDLPSPFPNSGQEYTPWIALNPRTGAMVAEWPGAAIPTDIHIGEISAAYLPANQRDWVKFGTPNPISPNPSTGIPSLSINPVNGVPMVSWIGANLQVVSAQAFMPPGPPGPPTLVENHKTTQHIEWTPAQDQGSDITSYVVQIATKPDGDNWQSNPGCPDSLTLNCTATGLKPLTDYYYRVQAINALGSGEYSLVGGPFQTLGDPGVVTNAASSVTPAGAQLNGAITAHGAATTPSFELSTNSDMSSPVNVTASPVIAADGVDVGISGSVSNLAPQTRYYFRALGTSAEGSGQGDVLSFMTSVVPPVPVATDATSITTTTATINGTVDGKDAQTAVSFNYGTTPISMTSSRSAQQSPINGSGGAQAVSLSLTSLTPNTTYYYQVVASNAGGVVTSANTKQFTTDPLPPQVATGSSELFPGGVYLRGTATPNGANLTVIGMQWGTSAALSGPVVTGTPGQTLTDVQFTVPVSAALAPNTEYFYRAVGTTNGTDFIYGIVRSFVTPAQLPVISTGIADALTSSTATVHGSVTSNGAATYAKFRWGTDLSLSSATTIDAAQNPFVAGASGASASADLTGLRGGVTYYYQITAINSVGTANPGTILSFTTPSGPPIAITNAAVDVTSTSATLRGVVNPNGAGTNTYFQYREVGQPDPATYEPAGALVAASVDSPISLQVNGLTPGTNYEFRAAAQNSNNQPDYAYGDWVAFSAPAVPPIPVTGDYLAGTLTASSVTVPGTVNAGGQNAAVKFQWSTNADFSSAPVAQADADPAHVDGNSAVPVQMAITGLAEDTTYYYRVIADNGVGGTQYAAPKSVLTPTKPSAPVNPSATGQDGGVLVSWSVPLSDGRSPLTRYAVSVDGSMQMCLTTAVPPAQPATSCTISGLTNGQSYTFRVTATNAVGTGPASVAVTGVPAGDLEVVTGTPNAYGTSVSFNGSGNSHGPQASLFFEYATNVAMSGSTTIAGQPDSTSGNWPSYFGTSASGFTPGATYYVRAGISRDGTNVYGDALPFVIPPQAPLVTTNDVSTSTATSATLPGSIDPQGATTSAMFAWADSQAGLATAIPVKASPEVVPAGTPANIQYSLGGLSPGTTYWYRAIGDNGIGDPVAGLTKSFTTPYLPAVATTNSPPTVNSGTSATISGSANAGGRSLDTWFEYSTDSLLNTGIVRIQTGPATGAGTVAQQTTLAGLQPQTTYYYRMAIGYISTPVSPSATGAIASFTTMGLPGPPVPTAAGQDTQISVNWQPPANTGGLPVLQYTVTSSPGNASCTTTGTAQNPPLTNCTLSGVVNGTLYSISVTATTVAGTSSPGTTSATPFGKPIPVTGASSLTGSTAAVVNGTVNANGKTATASFTWGTSQDLSTATTGSASPSSVSGVSATAVSKSLTGLQPGVTYYYRVSGSNDAGSADGLVQSFVVPALPPTAVTQAATSVTVSTATLNAAITANGAKTQAQLRYSTSNTPTNTNSVFVSVAQQVEGNVATSVSAPVSGLAPATTYYFQALASNSAGSDSGNVLSFTTPAAAPIVTTTAPTGVWADSAILHGKVSSNGASATGSFRISTDPAVPSGAQTVPADQGTIGPSATKTISHNITGLTPRTTYYYKAVATNSAGTSEADQIASFTTLGVPGAPQNVTGARGDGQVVVSFGPPRLIDGTIDDGGSPITGYTVTTVGSTQHCTVTYPLPDPLQCTVRGLSNGTSYEFDVTASNAVGTGPATRGAVSVPAGAPKIKTTGVDDVQTTSATLKGAADANGETAGTKFDIWPDSDPVAVQRVAADPGVVTSVGFTPIQAGITQGITGLTPNTQYWYRAVANNGIGGNTDHDIFGAALAFTTHPDAPRIVTSDFTNLSGTAVDLSADVYTGNADTSGTFRYSTDPDMRTGVQTQNWDQATVRGNSPFIEPVTGSLSGLTPATTYYVQAFASNDGGTAVGERLTFTTPGPPAVVTNTPALAITKNSATITGTINPMTGTTSYAGFIYGTDSHLVTGNQTVAIDNLSGDTAQYAEADVSSLIPGTRYYYRITATNHGLTTDGEIESFVTPGRPGPPQNVGGVAEDGSIRIHWNAPSDDGGSPILSYQATATPVGGGTAIQCQLVTPLPNELECSAAGLVNGMPYDLQVVATNDVGDSDPGLGDLAVKAASAPTVITGGADSVTSSSASILGSINANGAQTYSLFVWGTDPNLSDASTQYTFSDPDSVSGTADTAVQLALTGLEPGTTYYYKLRGNSGIGGDVDHNVDGTVANFTTPVGTPSATTLEPSEVSSVAATLNGRVNVAGGVGTTRFLLSRNENLSNPQLVPAGEASGAADHEVTAAAVGLESNNTYYYRVEVLIGGQTVFGDTFSFRTSGPPLAETLSAESVTTNSAVIHGSVDPNGQPTQAYFIWGPTSDLSNGQQAAPATPGDFEGRVRTPVNSALTGLNPGTRYYYQVVAANGVDGVTGAIKYFDTAAPGPSPQPDAHPEVSLRFVGLKKQYLVGTKQKFKFDVSLKSLRYNSFDPAYSPDAALVDDNPLAAAKATAGINGKVVLKSKQKKLCTATIKNGLGNCSKKLTMRGKVPLLATFIGTYNSVAVPAAKAKETIEGSSVLFSSAKITLGHCTATLVVKGKSSYAHRAISIQYKSGSRWVTLASVRSNGAGSWKYSGYSYSTRMKIRVSDGSTTSGVLIAKIAPKPLARAC